MKKLFLLLIFQFIFASVQAQDNQRYMALSLVNVNSRDNQLEPIQKASDIGMNAVIVTAKWDEICQLTVNAVNAWIQYDLQIQAALNKGMKICLHVYVHLGQYESNWGTRR